MYLIGNNLDYFLRHFIFLDVNIYLLINLMIYINNSHSQSTPITRYHTLPYPLTEKGVKQAQRNQSDGMYVISNIDGR